MRTQPFVLRRHAGHEHGHSDGFGVRLPVNVLDRERTAAIAGHAAPGSAAREVEERAPLRPNGDCEHTVEPGALTTIKRGSATGGVVYFDAPSGAGGDMLVAALIDLGVPWSVITGAVDSIGIEGVSLELRRGHSGALSGLRFVVNIDERWSKECNVGERSYAQIRGLLGGSRLAHGVSQRAGRVFERLARAESRAHHVPVEDVHFHEVGAIDSIVDIVGVCAGLDYLGGAVWCSPLPLGRGFVNCRHGVIPLPAPATVECLVGLRTYDAGIDRELVTPTAAAVFGALAAGCGGWPSGVLTAVGWGRGAMSLPDRPNLIRAVLVQPANQVSTADDAGE